MSVLPSSTTAAWTSMLTGSPPGETGVPGNEWFDREHIAFYAPNPISTDRRYQVLGSYNEDRLGRLIRVPTVYERAGMRSHVSLLQVYRGADMINIPEIEPFGTLFNAAIADLVGADSAEFHFYEKLDEVSIKSLDESIDRYGLADLQVVYFPGIDLFTHIAPSVSEDQQRYLERVIDPAIGHVLDRYAEFDVLDKTYVLFVSDHSQTPVLPEDASALSHDGEASPAEVLSQAGFRVRSRALKVDDGEGDLQAVLAMQGGMAFVYLADRSTCPEEGVTCDWLRAPRTEEDVFEAVRTFDEANQHGARVPALKGTIDMILARSGAATGVDGRPFKVYTGGRLVPIGSYFEGEPRPDLLQFGERLEQLATGPYGFLAGDILLLSRMRLEEPIERRTYFGEPYYTWHGSANAADSRVVFVLAHTARSGSSLQQIIFQARRSNPSQTDLAPFRLQLLSR